MLEKYAIKLKNFYTVPSGEYRLNRLGRKVSINVGHNEFVTDAGIFSEEEWRKKVKETIQEEGETDIFNIIIQHVKNNCAWLHKENDIHNYAMEIITNRSYLSGYPVWDDVITKINELKEKTYQEQMQF